MNPNPTPTAHRISEGTQSAQAILKTAPLTSDPLLLRPGPPILRVVHPESPKPRPSRQQQQLINRINAVQRAEELSYGAHYRARAAETEAANQQQAASGWRASNSNNNSATPQPPMAPQDTLAERFKAKYLATSPQDLRWTAQVVAVYLVAIVAVVAIVQYSSGH